MYHFFSCITCHFWHLHAACALTPCAAWTYKCAPGYWTVGCNFIGQVCNSISIYLKARPGKNQVVRALVQEGEEPGPSAPSFLYIHTTLRVGSLRAKNAIDSDQNMYFVPLSFIAMLYTVLYLQQINEIIGLGVIFKIYFTFFNCLYICLRDTYCLTIWTIEYSKNQHFSVDLEKYYFLPLNYTHTRDICKFGSFLSLHWRMEQQLKGYSQVKHMHSVPTLFYYSLSLLEVSFIKSFRSYNTSKYRQTDREMQEYYIFTLLTNIK